MRSIQVNGRFTALAVATAVSALLPSGSASTSLSLDPAGAVIE
jgi:hypothetical protein